ncbi:MAG: type IV pili methyl-accepting chemotaxis transducer N-terminal domain-containing protein [Acidobacteria bacterium]|nr:type IV pili methyl-accepting chemotaxis transducer N-terminal domain-containing protein [Acidobacteriota bacterium]
MTLKTRLLATFLAVAALNAAGALLLYWSVTAQRTNSVTINLAGAQRMLSQKMTKDALLLANNEGTRWPCGLRPAAFRGPSQV